jgi:SNF2 family DNA or RNA helicase
MELRDQAKTGLVCSWTMAQAALPELGLPKGPEGCTLLICDEAHYAKNLEAIRTRVVVSFSYTCTKVLLLTGTPMPNRASELFPLLHILRPGEFDSYTDFVDRFCILKSFSVGRSTITRVTGSKNLPQLRQILASHMLRRKKKQVLPQLPPKRWQQLLLPPDEVVVRASEELKDAANDPDNHTTIGLLAALRQKTGVAKVPAALEWIDNSSSPENPVVVFYHHRRVWRLMSSVLRKKKISFVTIQGSTSQLNRKKAVDTFQSGQTQVILVSTAGKEGITLTRAANLLKVERAWTPGDEAQLEDRIWRIGQKKPCLIVNLHLAGSTDDHIVGLLRRKSTDIRQTIEREIIERIRSANGYTYTGETPT